MIKDFRMGWPPLLNSLYGQIFRPSNETVPPPRLTPEEIERRRLLDIVTPKAEPAEEPVEPDDINPYEVQQPAEEWKDGFPSECGWYVCARRHENRGQFLRYFKGTALDKLGRPWGWSTALPVDKSRRAPGKSPSTYAKGRTAVQDIQWLRKATPQEVRGL